MPSKKKRAAAHSDRPGRTLVEIFSAEYDRQQSTHGGRRPGAGAKPGVRLRCGECGQPLTAREWVRHFAACPKRPAA